MGPKATRLIGPCIEALMLLAFGAFLVVPGAVVYDVVRFYQVRAYVGDVLNERSPDERAPNESVKRTFVKQVGSGQHVYDVIAWHACRDRLCGDYSDFDEKTEAWLLWRPLLMLIYSREEMLGVYLHTSGWLAGRRGVSQISRLAFGRDINELSERELYCLERLTRGRRRLPECLEINKLL